MEYTANELESLPTISVGQTCDLKVETPDKRVWLARTTTDDGEPYNDKVTVEGYDDDTRRWVEVEVYPGG